MRPGDLVSISVANLWRRKLRTLLTILAVVIGAALIGLMVSLSSGVQGFIVDQFGLFVPQEGLFVSSTGNSPFGGQGNSPGQPRRITGSSDNVAKPFTPADVDRIRAVPGVERVDPSISVNALSIRPIPEGDAYTVYVTTGPDYVIRLRKLVTGSYFAPDASGQCLVPYQYVTLFGWPGPEAALGKKVLIQVGKQNPYTRETREFELTVTGVIQNTLNASEVLVPAADAIEMARFYRDSPMLYSESEPGLILVVKTNTASQVEAAATQIEKMGFSVTTPRDILSRINSVFATIQVALAAFGIIALVVAAIGIINTLLMAVYERTREIGVMKAVGATRANVRSMFTMEGAVIGLFGGLLGVVLAWLLGQALNIAGSRTFLSDFPTFSLTQFPIWLVPAIVALTTFISLAAAVYPANRAARLDTVEALRYE